MWPWISVPGLGVISAYGPVRAVYFLLALWLVVRLNAAQGTAPRLTLRAFAWGVPLGLIGARGLDALEYASQYHALRDVVGRDGSSIYGSYFAVFVFLWVFTRWHGISFLRFLDAGAPAMALGEALSRIGCFLTGCCYGIPSDVPWVVTFPPTSFAFRDQVARGMLDATAPHSLAVHPVQLYSMVVMLVVTGVLIWWFYRPRAAGQVFCGFLVSYGVLRLGVAPFRTEVLGSMKVFSVLFIVAGLIGIWWTAQHRSRPADVLPLRRSA